MAWNKRKIIHEEIKLSFKLKVTHIDRLNFQSLRTGNNCKRIKSCQNAPCLSSWLTILPLDFGPEGFIPEAV